VEISRTLSQLQEEKLSSMPDSSENSTGEDSDSPHYKMCVSKHGPSVYWYKNITNVPEGFTMFVAHEFFDALPIHKFQASLQWVSSFPWIVLKLVYMGFFSYQLLLSWNEFKM